MKKFLISIFIILPLIFVSCTNKIVEENNHKPEINLNTNNDDKNNNEINEDTQIKNEGDSKEDFESQVDTNTIINTEEDTEVALPIESIIDSRFGYLDLIYFENDSYYLSLDEAEIFFGEEAKNEALIDNKVEYTEDGKIFLPNPYYIRNNYSNLSIFKISKDAKFYLCGFAIKGDKNDNSINLYEVSLEEFKEFTTKKSLDNDITKVIRWPIWADVQDGVAIKLYQQFIP